MMPLNSGPLSCAKFQDRAPSEGRGGGYLGVLSSVLTQPGVGLPEVIKHVQGAVTAPGLQHNGGRTVHLRTHLHGCSDLK